MALLQFQKALKKDEHHTPSRYHCGLMLHRLGQLEQAVGVFNHGKANEKTGVLDSAMYSYPFGFFLLSSLVGRHG